ncbi:MAG: hypothetical protein HC821_03580 [Lewinella sp.]|nr:hypothetical protein [Lewinella sp.]
MTFSLVAQSGAVCGSGAAANLSCRSLACPPLAVSFADLDTAYCLSSISGPLPLSAQISGGNGQGSSSWTGPGVFGATFDPRGLGPGSYTLGFNYVQSGPCSLMDSVRLSVFNQLRAGFEVAPAVTCVNQNTTITFSGLAVPGTVFNWDFGGATVLSGSGAGPYLLAWPAAGTYPYR